MKITSSKRDKVCPDLPDCPFSFCSHWGPHAHTMGCNSVTCAIIIALDLGNKETCPVRSGECVTTNPLEAAQKILGG